MYEICTSGSSFALLLDAESFVGGGDCPLVVGLAVGAAEQRVDTHDVFRQLVARQTRPQTVHKFGVCCGSPVGELHDCCHSGSPLGVRDADDVGIDDLVEQLERLLDLFGIHLFATGID